MLTPTRAEEQYAQAAQDDIRTLVVGAGIAGITAAQMLRRGGRHPMLIERVPDESHPGYMLALMPMVDAVLDDLGVHDEYRRRGGPLTRYGIHGHTGRMLREDPIASVLARYGDYRGISRGELIQTLTSHGCPVTFDSTLTALTQTADVTTATVRAAGETHQFEFDLVIIADGIHSTTRELVLGGRQVAIYDTKWGGWVVWAPVNADPDLGEELWGAGAFLGIYPVKDALGVFLSGPRADTKAGPRAFVTAMRRRLTSINPRLDTALEAVVHDPDPYYWSLTDCRAPAWAIGRTVLLGDAAAGFLPTAGIGAGMAMESAWVLTRMLRHAQRSTLPALLEAYERTQRPRVEAAQDTSRSLAKLMFHRSRALALLRDLAMRFVSVDVAIRPIQRLLATQPDPDRAGQLSVT